MNNKFTTASASSTPGIPVAVWMPALGLLLMAVLFFIGLMVGRKI